MKWKHKNVSGRMIRILDSHWNTYDIEPGEFRIIDKDSYREGLEVTPYILNEESIIEQKVEEEYKSVKKKKKGR